MHCKYFYGEIQWRNLSFSLFNFFFPNENGKLALLQLILLFMDENNTIHLFEQPAIVVLFNC